MRRSDVFQHYLSRGNDAMSKLVMIDYEKCVGCTTCMQACSAKHAGMVSTRLSRLDVIKFEMGIGTVPVVCAQCESAPCKAICPVKAVFRDETVGRVMVDYDKCIGCRMCVAVCPFGCMSFDSVDRKVFKCDLCDGDPFCVRFCQHGALEYVEAGERSTTKRTATAEKVSGIMRKITAAMATVP